jgi:hypothetical protein
MDQFIKHLPCPRCRSRDNFAEYTDHFFCFGCKLRKNKDDITSVRNRVNQRTYPHSVPSTLNTLDISLDIPKEAMRWLLSYGLTTNEISDFKIGWDMKHQLLVLLNLPTYWQARSFVKDRPKYSSLGKKPLTYYGMSTTIVCVEDIISAIKIARLSPNYCATPLLGCSLSKESLNTIAERFTKVVIWLDRDKAKEAIRISREFRQKGIECSVVISPEDPKEYTKEELIEWLKNK